MNMKHSFHNRMGQRVIVVASWLSICTRVLAKVRWFQRSKIKGAVVQIHDLIVDYCLPHGMPSQYAMLLRIPGS